MQIFAKFRVDACLPAGKFAVFHFYIILVNNFRNHLISILSIPKLPN